MLIIGGHILLAQAITSLSGDAYRTPSYTEHDTLRKSL
uniref:Uncharacterized protein n=1 Tax=Arundo donax TaxID=35708 RepID=A0A0A9G2J1_ARUDO